MTDAAQAQAKLLMGMFLLAATLVYPVFLWGIKDWRFWIPTTGAMIYGLVRFLIYGRMVSYY